MLKEMLMSNALLGESGGGGGGSSLTTATVQLVANGVPVWVSYCILDLRTNELKVANPYGDKDIRLYVALYNGCSYLAINTYGAGTVQVSGNISLDQDGSYKVTGDGTITILAHA